MQIEVYIRPLNNLFEVQIGLAGTPEEALTPVEREAFRNFGEPVVDCGGEFDDGDGLVFNLPTDERRFPSQFPVKQLFSLEDNADANDRAVLYRTTIEQRLVTARDEQTDKVTGTSGRFVNTL